MVIFWNHTLISLHYSQYYHQRLKVGEPCLGLCSTEEHKKGQVFTYFLTLMWRWAQCGQQFWNPDSSCAVKPLVLIRCPQGGQGFGRGSRSVGLGMQCLGWNKSHKPWWVPSLVCSPTSAQLSCSWCPGHRTVWAHHRCAMPPLIPGAVDVTSISSSLKGQKNKKHPTEPKNQELGFLYLFMISSCLGLTRWTSVIQITHQ